MTPCVGYFYWCGVIINFLIALCIVFGIVIAVKCQINELKVKKKYAVKQLKEK